MMVMGGWVLNFFSERAAFFGLSFVEEIMLPMREPGRTAFDNFYSDDPDSFVQYLVRRKSFWTKGK